MVWAVIALVSAFMTSCGGDATQGQPPTPTVASPEATATPVSAGIPAEFTVVPQPTTTPANTADNPPATPSSSPTITIGGVSFTVDLADTPEKRSQGLSGRPVLEDGTGMLFVFQRESQHIFWMKDMRFPLDMIWINAGCAVADITPDVPRPPPSQDDSALPTYSPSAPATYVLEINAGAAAAAGLQTGDRVTLGGSLTGRFGC